MPSNDLALATGGSRSRILARGTSSAPLEIGLGGDHEVVFARVAMPPGARIGWHFHPGPLLVVVQSGTLTRYQADGRLRRHEAGESFVEPAGPDHVHMAANHEVRPVVMLVAYLMPGDGPMQVAALPPADYVHAERCNARSGHPPASDCQHKAGARDRGV